MSIESKCESYHRKQTRLLEIYKIQMSAVNDISNRRVNINRHYLIIMSGVVIVFTAFTQINLDDAAEHLATLLKYFPIALGVIGFVIASIWLFVTDSYLRRNSRKYEVLKHLESKLEYNFLSIEWSTLGPRKLRKNYRSLAIVEFAMPFSFYVIFSCLYAIGTMQIESRREFKYLLLSIPILSIIAILLKIIIDHKQGKNETAIIRGAYNNQRKVN